MAPTQSARGFASTASWLGIFLLLVSNANTATARAFPQPTVGLPSNFETTALGIPHVTTRSESSQVDIFPIRNVTGGPAGEIKCYALPYGGIGILSHFLTYWTIAWVSLGRIPVWPWHTMTTHYKYDMALAIGTLAVCIPVASITIHRCWLSWHFILISVWKLTTSVSLACTIAHRAFITRREVKKKAQQVHHSWHNLGQNVQQARSSIWDTLSRSWLNPNRRTDTEDSNLHLFRRQRRSGPKDITPLWWLSLYLIGSIVGMVGLGALVHATYADNATVQRLTIGFGVTMVALPTLATVYWYGRHLERPQGGWRTFLSAYVRALVSATVVFVAAFGFFSAIYSDLVLGAIDDNLSGLPSSDFAPLYWAWFVGKRLPFLSL